MEAKLDAFFIGGEAYPSPTEQSCNQMKKVAIPKQYKHSERDRRNSKAKEVTRTLNREKAKQVL